MDCSPEYVEEYYQDESNIIITAFCHSFDKGGLFDRKNSPSQYYATLDLSELPCHALVTKTKSTHYTRSDAKFAPPSTRRFHEEVPLPTQVFEKDNKTVTKATSCYFFDVDEFLTRFSKLDDLSWKLKPFADDFRRAKFFRLRVEYFPTFSAKNAVVSTANQIT